MKKRALSWLLALGMLLSLAPQALPWASAAETRGETAESPTESKLSANTYSALGLSRSINAEDEGLNKNKQPYGDAKPGNTVATNVINELYVNFNGSIHYGWSILDNIPMQWTDNAHQNWYSTDNFYGAMGYWRKNLRLDHLLEKGKSSESALFAENRSAKEHRTINSDIRSSGYHLGIHYSKSEAFSPNTGKDNYVAELSVSLDSKVYLAFYQVEDGNKRLVRKIELSDARASRSIGDKDDKTNRISNWEYDAMYDIAAGDMNGDGYDEIAVYAGDYVYLYTSDGYGLIERKSVTLPTGINDGGGKFKKLNAAVVTLAFGDINTDDKDELIIAENMGYGASNVHEGKVGIYALTNGKLDPQGKKIPLKHDNKYVRYANVATGDIDGDNKEELIIAGYQSNNQYSCDNGEHGTISYMIVKGSDYHTSGWKTADQKIELLRRVVNNSDQLIPPVSLTCAATQGVGHAEQLFLGGCLYSVNTDGSLEYLTRISTNREYRTDDGDSHNKEEIFVVNVVAGNFNGNRHGQEQIVYAFGMKSHKWERYWYDIGYINKKDPGPTRANEPSAYWYGQEQVMNFELSFNREENKPRASLYLSLAAVDCDKDSTLMRYKGQEITWTKPEVLTILQSAPYFQDLQDTRDYLDESKTSYGKSQGSGTGGTTGGKLSIGSYVSFEQDFSVFGVKIASVEAELQQKNTFNYGYAQHKEVETEVNYSGSAGDDYAVVYAVPFMAYQYETWVPGYEIPKGTAYQGWMNEHVEKYLTDKDPTWAADLSDVQKQVKISTTAAALGLQPGKKVPGSWQPSTVSVPMTPRTVLISVDDYDAIAAQTEGLQPIRGNILNSTPGDPTTYDRVKSREGFHPIGSLQTVSKAQGGNISVTQTSTETEEHNFEYEYEFEAKAGAGAGGVTVGLLAGFGLNAGGGISKSTAQSYSGTVDNLPNDVDGYSLSWQFGWRKATLNNNDVLVLEYQQQDTEARPSPPRNLRVEAVTSDSVTLQWDGVPGAGAYVIYQIASDGAKLRVATVPGTATSYTDTRVDPSTSYTYCMKNVSKAGTSIYSTEVEAYTLTQNSGKFIITQQPGENNTFSSYIGGAATATVRAEYQDQDGTAKLQYSWQKYNAQSKTWEQYAQGNSNTIHIPNVTKAMDGDKFRCRVYYNARLYIYTEVLTLEVGKAKSTTSLRSEQAGQTVNASYVKTEEVPTGEMKDIPKEVTAGGETYIEYKSQKDSVTVYLGKDGKYYSINGNTATPLTETTENVKLTYIVGTEEEGTEENTISFEKLIPDPSFTGPVTYVEQDEAGGPDITHTATAKYTVTGDTTVVYQCHEDATETLPARDFWFVMIDEAQYAADVQTVTKLTVNGTPIAIDDLEQVTKQVQATTTEQTFVEGTRVALTATVQDVNAGAGLISEGNVVFKIVNSVGDGSGTETAPVQSGAATATWTPLAAGVYTITAAYEGSDKHLGSSSDAAGITINVVVPGEKNLVIDGPNSMTYGDAPIDLRATLLAGATVGGADADVTTPTDVNYSVRNAVGETVEYVTSDHKFAPTAAGNYTITAACEINGESFTATKNIAVNKRTVTIVPSVSEDKVVGFTLKGIANDADKTLFVLNGNVTIACDGITATAAGDYPITVTYTPTEAIEQKYTVVCDNTQVYPIRDDVVTVKNETDDSNGSVTLKYTVDDETYFELSGSSANVPKGAKLIAAANPNTGYQVKQWTVNGKVLTTGEGGTLETAQTITVAEAVNEEYRVKAEFTLLYYTLNFEVTDGTKRTGSITANYLEGGTAGGQFTNGTQLSPLQRVQLTAKVDPGQSIKEWQISRNNSTPETLMLNGKPYTGQSYVLPAISANTKVTVLTENQEDCTVTIHLVDANGTPLINDRAKVSFNANTMENTETGIYTYHGHRYDNLTVTLTLPDSLVVEDWKSKEGDQLKPLSAGTLANNKKTWNISNLPGSLDLTVVCSTANTCTITTSTNVQNGAEDETGGTLKVYQLGRPTEVTSVLQASTLLVKVEPESGYQILDVTCNGESQMAALENETEFRVNDVNENISIVATFVKKPVITIDSGTNGTVTAPTSGAVRYGHTTPIVFTATPNTGHEVDTWTVNGELVTGVPAANSDDQTYTYTPDPATGITSDVKVAVTFKALPTATVNFSVVDKNGPDEDGFDGSVTASVGRKGMDAYKESKTANSATKQTLTVYRDSTVVLSAQADSGYVAKWIYDDDESLSPPQLDFSSAAAMKDHEVQVRFDPVGAAITFTKTGGNSSDVTATFAPENGGEKPFGSGNTPNTGGTLTLTVAPDTGYEVEGWYVNGQKQDKSAGKETFAYSVTHGVGASIEVKIIRSSYAVTVNAVNGTITAIPADQMVVGDTSVTFTARPVQPDGYTFAGWKINDKMPSEYENATVNENGTLTVVIKEAVDVTATYTQDTTSHTVTYAVNDPALGSLHTTLAASPATVANGSKVTFTAAPKEGNYVKGWYSDEDYTQKIPGTGEETSYSVTVYRNTNVYVNFEKKPTYKISLTKRGEGNVFATVNGGTETEVTAPLTVKYHDKVVLRAEAAQNQYFVGWQDNTTGTYTIADVTEDISVTATFAPSQSVYLKASSMDTSKGTLTATGSVTGTIATNTAGNGVLVAGGQKITLTANPKPNQMVQAWTINGTVVEGNLSNTLVIDAITANTTVTVAFEDYTGFAIPQTSPGNYTVTEVTRIPDDTTPKEKIRDRGTVSFKVTPAADKLLGVKNVSPNGTVVANADGSYTVTIQNVTEAIVLQMAEYKAERGELTVPEGSQQTLDQLRAALRAKISSSVSGSNIKYLDIKLQIRNAAGNWEDVTEETFPKGGIRITILYEKLGSGLDKSYTYSVAHMLANGTVESLEVTNEANGISFHVNSLSPFAIGWYKTPSGGGGGGGGGGGAVSTYTLTFETNGGSAVDKLTKDSGTTVDLTPYKPTRAGYAFAGWYSDKALTKAVTSVKLTANTTVYAKWTPSGSTTQNPFVDVTEDAYYYDAVLWAVAEKITSGTSATTFDPDASCTRAQMVTFLWRAAGSPKVENEKNPFTDVKADAYYYDAVLWAVEKGVTSGTSATTFSPDATVTRAQTVTFLYRNAGAPDVTGATSFTDVDADAYYAKAVLWAVQQKITTGTSESTFSPTSDCTRGQIVTFLWRCKA